MKLSDLSGNPRNPRKITDEKLKMLEKALNEFGDLSGIVFNRRSGQLVGGHQRLKVLPHDAEIVIDQTLSTPTTTGTVAEGHVLINGESFRYREVDWDDTKEKAANIAANKHGGEFDLPILSEWLLELDSMNIDMDLTGFDQTELENIMAPVHQVEGQCDDDEVPEVQAEPITKRGDIYQLGRHRLMCGDSTSPTDLESLMGANRADICFTSPPYNVGNNGNMKGQEVGKKYLSTSDDKSESDYLDFLTENLNLCLTHASEVFYNIQLLGANKLVLVDLLSRYKESFKDLIYWVKDNAAPHIEPGVMSSYVEWIICLSLDNNSKKFHKTNAPRGSLKNVIRGPGNGQNEYSKIHNATFPVYLAEAVINDFSKPRMIVLDTFGGSGTTMVAAEKTGRCAYLMELDPKYCDVIVARWENFTGQKAKLLTAEVPNS